MTLDDAGSLAALGAGLIFLIPLLLIGIVVIVVVSNRADPDPTGRRPLAVYLYAASFVTLFVTMFASFGIVARLCSLIGTTVTGGDAFSDGVSSDDGFSGDSGSTLTVTSRTKHPVGDAVTRDVVIFALVALVAGAALYLHLRAAGRLTDPGARSGPVGRVRSSYVAAVSFVSVLLAVTFAIVTVYAVFRLVSPAIFAPGGDGSRAESFRTIVPGLYFTALSLFVLLAHLRSTPTDQRPVFRRARPVAPLPGPYDVSAPADYPAAPAGPPPTGTATVPPTTGGDVLGDVPPPPRRRPRPNT
jgi:hypothetical protein